MANVSNPADNRQSQALPADVLDAKLRAMERRIGERLIETIREQNHQLLEKHRALKPLLSFADAAKTLSISESTLEKIVANGKIQPLWVRGQRRFHPDQISAYLRKEGGR